MTIDHIKKVLLTNSYMENNLKKKFKRFGYQNIKIPDGCGIRGSYG